jgi:SAM-dependent methyltransferase
MNGTHESAARAYRYRPFHVLSAHDVWASIARNYAAFTSPLVPCAEDIRALEHAVARSLPRRGSGVRAIILGVTPGVALMKWPIGATITAVDSSPDVIAALWPGDVSSHRRALCASWLKIPVAPNSCDVVVGDGSLNTFRFHDDARTLIQALRSMLVDGGTLALRIYVRPQRQESVGQVMDALRGARGMAVDSFKMRLWMALQRSVEEGVKVRHAARVLDGHGLDAQAMQGLGWSDAAIAPFSTWQSSDAVYSFPALDELHEIVGGHFDVKTISYPDYELGGCCPTVVMRARQ